MKRLRACLTTIVAFACALGAPGVSGQTYPAKPVRIIVPFAAGQGTDVATRHFADQLSRALGQNFIIDNRPGAGGSIGLEALAKSAPDGYTLGAGSGATLTMNPYLYSSIGYDPEKDFEPITLTGKLPLMIVANPAFAANSIQELIGAARAKPDTINVGFPGPVQRIIYEMLRLRGVPLFGVGYKGSPTLLTDTIGGQIPLAIDSVTALRPHIAAGKLKALAVTTLAATDLMPGVRSVAEQGLPGFEMTAWNALLAPKGTPAPIIATIHSTMQKILELPDTRQRLAALGFEAVGSTPQQLAELGRAEREKWSAIIRANNIRAD